ncbi:TetR/AcrR family transcriptional regulator [Nocardioides sp. zg-536]|uniref:TetR/AcrR family transcriptional regulator n=1 Tax=Nocardioides faecalis TaxID=2803858 RepID=A0A938Y5P2_9ACTN|nr:TetR/AcrR family transcriptional regulator [Nocardioides faecalis]MBM9459674.1 TetR/AcrR family transcriptional regulator [Nocardioides faecalis]MBS4753549.1 TetR/AcrR family transcriptional regulator [Nocardioides faecalis]QVI58194.1 TetR/AcrR family transcriptional regulator [Nocardioides faecalis]
MAVQSGIYKGVSAADRAAERRSRLLEATLSVWADPGTRTTMTAVCAAAGLTERYFYESFKNLDEAQSALLEAVAVEIETTTLAAAEAAGADPAARIHAAITALVELLTADPRKGRVAIIEAGTMPALRGRRTELLRHFAHLAAAEAHEGGLPRRDRQDELAGLLFIGGMAEVVTAWLDGVLDATPEEIVQTASRSFLGLYG